MIGEGKVLSGEQGAVGPFSFRANVESVGEVVGRNFKCRCSGRCVGECLWIVIQETFEQCEVDVLIDGGVAKLRV